MTGNSNTVVNTRSNISTNVDKLFNTSELKEYTKNEKPILKTPFKPMNLLFDNHPGSHNLSNPVYNVNEPIKNSYKNLNNQHMKKENNFSVSKYLTSRPNNFSDNISNNSKKKTFLSNPKNEIDAAILR